MNNKQTTVFETAECFCFIKIKRKQTFEVILTEKQTLQCFFFVHLQQHNKSETYNGEARRNHTIPTG